MILGAAHVSRCMFRALHGCPCTRSASIGALGQLDAGHCGQDNRLPRTTTSLADERLVVDVGSGVTGDRVLVVD